MVGINKNLHDPCLCFLPYTPIKTFRLKVESAHMINHKSINFFLTTKESNLKANDW